MEKKKIKFGISENQVEQWETEFGNPKLHIFDSSQEGLIQNLAQEVQTLRRQLVEVNKVNMLLTEEMSENFNYVETSVEGAILRGKKSVLSILRRWILEDKDAFKRNGMSVKGHNRALMLLSELQAEIERDDHETK
jgi:hypothetical protein